MIDNPQSPDSQQQNNAPSSAKPVVHPAVAVILTIIIVLVGAIAGGFIGALLGGFGALLASIGSLFFTIPLSGRLFRTKSVTNTGEVVYNDGRGAAKAASVGFIVFGLVIGFVVGAIINFGACFKSECSPLEAGAPLYLPAASLLISVPLARRTFRNKGDGLGSKEKVGENEEMPNPTDSVGTAASAVPESSAVKPSSSKRTLIVIGGALLFAIIVFFAFGPSSPSSRLSNTENEISNKGDVAQRLVSSDYGEVNATVSEQNTTYFADADHDACYEINIGDKFVGQYETICAYRKTQFFGFDGDHSSTLLSIENKLLQSGWSPRGGLDKPIDSRLKANSNRQSQNQRSEIGTATTSLIRSVAYEKDDSVLYIYDAEKDQELSYTIERAQEVSGAYSPSDSKSSNFQNIQSLTSKIFSEHQFMLVVSIENQYYQSY